MRSAGSFIAASELSGVESTPRISLEHKPAFIIATHMTKVVQIDATYDSAIETLWRHVVRYDALEAMMSGALVRVACPAGEECVGDDVALTFRLFGVVPVGRWRFKVVARDDAAFRLRSEESGTGVRRWAHEIALTRVDDHACRFTDTIEIEAGALTPLIAWFARREYARRHRLRKILVQQGE